ncbi:NAD-dependent succinate-semialdehyde dehydrogenase [Ammoniphilus sp. CFH 90114]|uniref:NAD-dependent succinate-semialdehyde dehydrogenase n=1 Tax=Ammoniphilus sp. CFH 90114 TaxID=2493665 RepID=UPI00100E4A69|nr:NAD-dependent succinate-semialdehyde dehydrogenase [Ammoniphilus sp. CFH 90114]RXT07222.1 NAD-dependent succinate-semialdehyde dehydrogenase [Ammoniphilus sp. CFH 90114]
MEDRSRKMLINGQWMESLSGKQIALKSPATGETIAHMAYGGREEAIMAIEAAHDAFADWSTTPAKERSAYLLKIVQLMQENKADLAHMISLEMGKPIREARGEVDIAIDYVQWYAEEAKRVYGDLVPSNSKTKRILVVRQPVGVTAAITPWNFPLSMVTRKIAPALAAGCTVILKPAKQTPGSAILFFELMEKAGLPKGVANLVLGNAGEIAEAFTSSSYVKKITFTGSTEVGKQLLNQASHQVKRVSMELGGHAPFIVFPDADLEKSVEGLIASKFRNSGQTCICTNRVYVHTSIIEPFSRLLKQKIEKMVMGNGLREDVDLGPIVDRVGLQKIEEQVQDSLDRGAKLLSGGRIRTDGELGKGYFYEPTILVDVDDEMRVAYEETFGPVVPILPFETEQEVLEKANHTPFGLAAYFYTKDLGRTIRMYEGLEYGIIGANDPIPTTVQAPFGGFKESGIGREGGYYGMEGFLETKYVSLGF